MLGHCFVALLSLASPGGVAFVGRFLKSSDADIQLEAASALAQCRDPQAIDVLKDFWHESLISLELRRLLLIGLGASPLADAAEFLLSVVSDSAVEARGDPSLRSMFHEQFEAAPPL